MNKANSNSVNILLEFLAKSLLGTKLSDIVLPLKKESMSESSEEQ